MQQNGVEASRFENEALEEQEGGASEANEKRNSTVA